MNPSEERYVKICPYCGSTDLSSHSEPAAVRTGMVDSVMKCNHCGYVGHIAEISASEVPESPKPLDELPERPMVDKRYGKGIVTGVLKIVGPLMIALSGILFLQRSMKFTLLYLLPQGIFLTLFSFKGKYFQGNTLLKIFAIVMVLYLFLGPILLGLVNIHP